MSLIDELRLIRTYFFLGMYNEVIKETQSLPSHLQSYGNIWMFRAMTEMDPMKMAHELPDEGTMEQRIFKLYSIYKTGDASFKEQVVAQLHQLMLDPDLIATPLLQIYGTYIFLQEKNYKDALQLALLTTPLPEDQIEKYALQVLCLLYMNRPEIAQGHLTQLQSIDDDDILGSLATIWLAVAQPTQKPLEHALEICNDLNDRSQGSSVLYDIMSVVYLGLGRYKESFVCSRQSREWMVKNYNSVNPTTLLNSMVCMFHKGGSLVNSEAMVGKMATELGQFHPTCDYFTQAQEIDQMFDQAVAEYQQ